MIDWKQAVREMLDQLPDDCDLEEIFHGLYTLESYLDGPLSDAGNDPAEQDDVWSGRQGCD